MSLNGSVSYSSSDPFGVRNNFRLPSNLVTLPSGLITPNQNPVVNGVAIGAQPRTSRLYWVIGMLTSIYPIYLKLYDTAVAPTPGVGTPFLTLPLTSNTVYNGTTVIAAPLGFEFNFADIGVSFLQGIGYTITKLPADNDTTAIIVGDVTGLNIAWQ